MFIVKITSKGQITIPAGLRKRLGSELLEVDMVGEEIIMRPIKKPGGALKKYALKDKSIDEIMRMEEDVAKNEFSKKHNDY
ncbi:AbrB/MazE/SpoVT family DNA-binding domain-containing protein [Thermodesulfatator atlanticus]|uniref:AbrB/MazE/SpoVT family DNA-binding domain-containing protein n=1 Tax=Thermodesulfatator atlanticus TaxID=501497 RepID=UPI0003B57D72|nr:AbrB/MazE/SpoVT family DNA-binding domain-containing protein [Thermodesulfatator atlanticus]